MEALDFSGLTVDDRGRVSFSGLSSGLDFETIVDGIITAKRVPVDLIETRITENTEKIAALKDLRTLLQDLKDSVRDLRGAVTLGNTGDAFAATQAFATSSRSDGGTPSDAGNLLGVSTTNAAATGSHTLEILRVAAAQKVASTTFSDATSALGFSGAFEIEGSGGSASITVNTTDTLQDIRDRINNANAGSSATEVSASIVDVSSTEFVLVITADKTGERMAITEDDGGTVLSSLGISSTNGSGAYRNGLATSKIEGADGFDRIVFDGTQSDAPYQISYDSGTTTLTVTLLDGTGSKSDTYTLTEANGTAETATFTVDGVGVTIEVGTGFDKTSDITVDADATSVTGGTGAIDAATVEITDSSGDISGITSSTLTLGDLGTPSSISVTTGSFTGTFDGTSTGTKSVTLSDGNGNSLDVQFDVTAVFDGTESAGTITLNELENVVGAAADANFDNQLQDAQSARFTADGLLDVDRYESSFISGSTTTLSSLVADAATTGSFDIQVGSDTVTVNYDASGSDTISDLADQINSAITAAGAGNAVYDAGTTASLMSDGDGVRLVITNTDGSAITRSDTNGLLADLGVDNNLVIERTSNTVSDLFDGVTLTLFQAEEGTTVKIDVEQDLTSAKTQILAFVESYNALQSSLNEHTLTDSTTGGKDEDAGALFGMSILADVESEVAQLLVDEVNGVDDAYAILAQAGITLVDRNQDDPLLENTLEVDEAILDEALLNNAEDVQRLFAFDFSSSDPQVSLLGFTGKTSYDAAGYTLNINFADTYGSDSFTDGGSFTQVDAQDSGPAGDGISAIGFDDDVVSGNAYRYSYDSSTEELTVIDLTSGTSETVDITSTLDAIGDGGDLDAGETADIGFSTLGVTITLSGDNGFTRGTDISDGTLDISGLDANTTMTNGSVSTPTSGMDSDTVDALRAAGAYDTSTGLLTLGVTSNGSGEVHFDTASGIKFRVDGGSITSDITGTDLDDGAAHTIDLYVNDGSSDVMVGTLSFDSIASTAAGSGSLTVDLGTGLLAETSTVTSDTAPMENYMTSPALASGTIDISNSGGSLGTVAYSTTDSLQDLATNITNNVTDVTASVVDSGGTFQIQIVHSSRDALTITEAGAGNLLDHLDFSNVGDEVYSANIGGAADGTDNGTVDVSGRSLTVTDSSTAEGLSVYFNGSADLSGVQLDFTTGFAARLYYTLDDLLDSSGIVETELDSLDEQNELNQERVDDMLARLDLQKQSLLERFIALESTLLAAQNLREQLQQTFDAMFGSQDS